MEQTKSVGSFVISLADFRSVEAVRTVNIPAEALQNLAEQDIVLTEPVRLVVRFVLLDKEYLVRGTLRTSFKLGCSRCLSPFVYSLSIPFHNIYSMVDHAAGEDDFEIVDKRDLEISLLRGSFIDIREIVEEQILLNIPLKPLCSEQCKGLCTECGSNLNEGTCSCTTVTIDPRFEVLRAFFPQADEKKESEENIDKE